MTRNHAPAADHSGPASRRTTWTVADLTPLLPFGLHLMQPGPSRNYPRTASQPPTKGSAHLTPSLPFGLHPRRPAPE